MNDKNMIARDFKETDIEELADLFDKYRIFYRKESDLEGAKNFILERVKNNDSKIFIFMNGITYKKL